MTKTFKAKIIKKDGELWFLIPDKFVKSNSIIEGDTVKIFLKRDKL